jgi:hypothetical protein
MREPSLVGVVKVLVQKGAAKVRKRQLWVLRVEVISASYYASLLTSKQLKFRTSPGVFLPVIDLLLEPLLQKTFRYSYTFTNSVESCISSQALVSTI